MMKVNTRIPIIFSFRRYVTEAPRVRFAPSPTGYLHLGGLRTALYNKLFAKSQKGSFILRIEDTDRTRKVQGSVEALIKDLEWAGITCDEGPGVGGQRGPYIQSERLDIYREYITKLFENGSAYKCFCSERRLNLLRSNAARSHSIPRYDNRCRHLTIEEIKAKMQAGVSYCIRFKLTSECQYFEDMIFGGIAYDVSINEGDPVLMKSDGYPTYHFANVVDDYLMGITHVLRGVEWQISTTKHLLIYKAFGWKPPSFGHLPLIINADGTKLSKRQSDVKVEDYRQKGEIFKDVVRDSQQVYIFHPEKNNTVSEGAANPHRLCFNYILGPRLSFYIRVFPLALVNYITLSGGGFDHVPGAGIRLKSMDDLADEINRISPHPTRLNSDLLEECNRLEIKRRLQDKNELEPLIAEVQHLVKNTYPQENLNVTHEHVKSVLEWATSRISTLEDLVTIKYAFLWILPKKYNEADINKELLKKFVEDLETLLIYDQKHLKRYLRDFSSNNDINFPILMKMLRAVLSGLSEGPSVAEMMLLLGKHQSLIRIKASIQ